MLISSILLYTIYYFKPFLKMLFCDIQRVSQIASQLWKLTPPEFLVLEIVPKIDVILCLDLNNVNPVEAGFVVFNWLLAKTKNKTKQTNK